MSVEGIREDWFPTSIWYFDHHELKGHHDLWRSELYRIREEDRVGITSRSTQLGWHSETNLHQNPAFKPLIEVIYEAGEEVADFGQWALSDYRVELLNAWGIINPQHGYNTLHNHPLSFLSGVYYLQTPANCGEIEFRDPREVRMMEVIPQVSNNRWTYKTVQYQPVEGRMIIFPSWLLHQVKPNLNTDDRICISFNLGCSPRINSENEK
ncbi:MAG: TIGR02466 family protein [Verrucomicrobiales bacterium]|nr:TIGR02466 family protein [Verrucomicrobiales bacterium]